MRLKSLLATSLFALAALPAPALDIVKDGKSPFVIYVAKDCPSSSVKWSAAELQKYCKAVTGATLPVVSTPQTPMICLGFNDETRKAGFDIKGMMPESYAFRAKNGNLYIFGEDTPDGQCCTGGGTSHATRNAVCTILEDFFGVRWVMPGPDGDFWKPRRTIAIPDEGRLDEPAFLNRRVPCIQAENLQTVRDWSAHQKLGYSLYLEHSHNWFNACPPSMFKEHPEWYAQKNGKPVHPTGELYFLCLTNRSTIERYAQAAEEYFRKYPKKTCYSLSPNDAANWCDCPNCSKFYGEKDPNGNPSYTTYILTFYNEVAKIFHPRNPGKILAGYIYQDYIYPPAKPIKLEDGLFLVWAVSFDYGYTLFRESTRRQFDALLPQWPACTENIAYYDLPTYTKNTLGIPCTPGLEILKFIFPRIKENKMKGVYFYGNRAWGHAAVGNYITAKLTWNPYADVDALFTEFCDVAYAEASPQMQQIYRLYDNAVKDYYVKNESESFTISKGRMKAAYADTLPKVAELFEKGYAKVTDVKAKARLDAFKINLQLMEWNLKMINVIPKDFTSCFTASDDTVNAILANPKWQFAIHNPLTEIQKPRIAVKAGKGLALANLRVPPQARIRGQQTIVFTPKSDKPVEFTALVNRVFGTGHWLAVYDLKGNRIEYVPVAAGKTASFKAKPGETYIASYITSTDIYSLKIANAFWGFTTDATDEGIHLQAADAQFFFNVPEGTSSFEAWLRCGDSIRETCLASMKTPTGRIIDFDCSHDFYDTKTLHVLEGEHGIWSIVITKSDVMHYDDHFFKIIQGIPPVICQDPTSLIICK